MLNRLPLNLAIVRCHADHALQSEDNLKVN
jgi:hypothetical protein